jgi:hypothetical protein
MYYFYVEIKYVATSFSPARTDLALKLLNDAMLILYSQFFNYSCDAVKIKVEFVESCMLKMTIDKLVVNGAFPKT